MPLFCEHDDVIKWKNFPRYWPFVRGIHRSPMNSPHKGQWRGALMFSLICAWINDWVNNREVGDLRRHRAHYDLIVMNMSIISGKLCPSHFLVWPAYITSFCQFHYVINSTCQNSTTSGNLWINQSQLSHHGVNNDIQTFRQTWTMQQMPCCRSFDRLATTTLLVPTKTYIEIFIQDFFSYEI